ncbi:hypothetical protein CRV00_11955 [Malaciobacter molluscorum]|uniref:plasmid mobilization protein n=1 Tax=Malaciobacter molluscorum TaxID=1032072 RepID=UPI0010263264|nr:ribbon-helix-helix protein, CopG family [Malaciobacter molluscorum]RXJ92855.1 hypothetical protein CRV00_11955 [Malaciobacter molluscorum]
MFDNTIDDKYLTKNEESSISESKKSDLRDVQLKVRLTQKEMDRLEEAAKEKGLTKSFLIQRYIRGLK